MQMLTIADLESLVLTPAAASFLERLARRFEPIRAELLVRRRTRQRQLDAGARPDFLRETAAIRQADWRVAPIAADLRDRRVEITGPVDRKMVINALNSGANVFMADFEDSHSPTWRNTLEGQLNLRDAVNGTISFTSPEGRQYRLAAKTATLMVRPRGWHLPERHFLVDGAPIAAALFDFGLFLFHNAGRLLESGTAPYFYLPKLENHLEARLWNDVFCAAQDELGLSRGTIRATVLIETILAAFEMDEILYELRDHSAGLNCGRWDYIFSFIKKFRNHPAFVLPDRATVGMDRPCLKAYVDLLIQTCHRRGVHAIGGMAAQIPIKDDPAANEAAIDKVRRDKLREVNAGHDGTWVAHPGLVPIAKEVFDAHLPTANQIEHPRPPVHIEARDLLDVPAGDITEEGLRWNVDVGLQYLASWLGGQGCVPIYHLMEDAATAEICRTQIWQWLRHRAAFKDGRPIEAQAVRTIIDARKRTLHSAHAALAGELFEQMILSRDCPEFLTLLAYEYLV